MAPPADPEAARFENAQYHWQDAANCSYPAGHHQQHVDQKQMITKRWYQSQNPIAQCLGVGPNLEDQRHQGQAFDAAKGVVGHHHAWSFSWDPGQVFFRGFVTRAHGVQDGVGTIHLGYVGQ